ncbi:hypothetical protein [Pseudomonas shirazensis]
MYLAQLSTFQTQAPFYINTLENIIAGDIDGENKNSIDSAIFEAVQVAKGDKNVFSINNDHYFFITTLLAKYSENLIKIENQNFQNNIYKEILIILK